MYENIVYCPQAQGIQAEQSARTERRRALRSAFEDINQLIINTGKHPKAEAAMRIVQSLVAPNIDFSNGKVLQLPSTKDEPSSINAVEVSRYKAEVARHEYVENKFPELFFLLNQLNLAFKNNLAEHVINNLFKGIIFLGADINAFVANGQTGELSQQHKLDRETDLFPEEMYEDLRKELYQTYVHPKTGHIKAIWQIATVTINGYLHHFSDWIEVMASPIEAELLEKYLAKALANGLILKSNTHLELFEMLCESGKIRTISRLPGELLAKGHNFEQFRQSAKPEEIKAIQKSITTNAPVYVG